MQLVTSRFGTLEVPDDDVLVFTAGLPGFPGVRRFVSLSDQTLAPFTWLQSTDDSELAFLTVPPRLLVADYQPEISPEARVALELAEGGTPEVLAIVTLGADFRQATANLRAPLLINRQQRLARQEVGLLSRYAIRHRLCQDE